MDDITEVGVNFSIFPAVDVSIDSADYNFTDYAFYDTAWLNASLNFNLSLTGVNATAYNDTLKVYRFCEDWEVVQHKLYQTANMFFAAAFLIPKSFKQSLLLMRALLCSGYFLCAIWAGIHDCAPDVFFWNVGLVFLNALHTALLTCRFLPPPLSEEIAELYLKLFAPLHVNKKHFKEVVKEGEIMALEEGETYAIEELTAADERLSILLTGRLRVTCDDTHLHYITPYQFVDSPEWEANHENSDDVFQVTITAEEDCTYLCWSRLKLERVLRHRPLMKALLYSMIGKDITLKLYSLNEHITQDATDKEAVANSERKTIHRCLSADAVYTGPQGRLRSVVWRSHMQRRNSASNSERSSPTHAWIRHPGWTPVVANHFPPTYPFSSYPRPAPPDPNLPRVLTQTLLLPAPVALTNIIFPVLVAPPSGRSKSFRRPKGREVKFDTLPV